LQPPCPRPLSLDVPLPMHRILRTDGRSDRGGRVWPGDEGMVRTKALLSRGLLMVRMRRSVSLPLLQVMQLRGGRPARRRTPLQPGEVDDRGTNALAESKIPCLPTPPCQSLSSTQVLSISMQVFRSSFPPNLSSLPPSSPLHPTSLFLPLAPPSSHKTPNPEKS
jgi:hypothetical protein